MTSIDQENLRRAQSEARMQMNASSEGRRGTWLIVIALFIAALFGLLALGSNATVDPASTGAPAVETAPAPDVAPAAAAPATD